MGALVRYNFWCQNRNCANCSQNSSIKSVSICLLHMSTTVPFVNLANENKQFFSTNQIRDKLTLSYLVPCAGGSFHGCKAVLTTNYTQKVTFRGPGICFFM